MKQISVNPLLILGSILESAKEILLLKYVRTVALFSQILPSDCVSCGKVLFQFFSLFRFRSLHDICFSHVFWVHRQEHISTRFRAREVQWETKLKRSLHHWPISHPEIGSSVSMRLFEKVEPEMFPVKRWSSVKDSDFSIIRCLAIVPFSPMGRCRPHTSGSTFIVNIY